MKRVISLFLIVLVASFFSSAKCSFSLLTDFGNIQPVGPESVYFEDSEPTLHQNAEILPNEVKGPEPEGKVKDLINILDGLENVNVDIGLSETVAETILDVVGENYTVKQVGEVLKTLQKVLQEQPTLKCAEGTKCGNSDIVHFLKVDTEYKAEKLGELIGQVTKYVDNGLLNEIDDLNVKKNVKKLDKLFEEGEEKLAESEKLDKEAVGKVRDFIKKTKCASGKCPVVLPSSESIFKKALKAMSTERELDEVYQLHVASNAIMEGNLFLKGIDPKEALDVSDSIAKAKEIVFTGEDPINTVETAVFGILKEDKFLPFTIKDKIDKENLSKEESSKVASLAIKAIDMLDEVLSESKFKSEDLSLDVIDGKEGGIFAEAIKMLVDETIQESRDDDELAEKDIYKKIINLFKFDVRRAIEYSVNNIDVDSRIPAVVQLRDNVEEYIEDNPWMFPIKNRFEIYKKT